MNFGRLQPTYVSLRVANTGIDPTTYANSYSSINSSDNTIFASVSQTINNSIFKNAQDYVVAVERLELSTNGIPFYAPAGEQIFVTDNANNLNFTIVTLNTNAYSLTDLFAILNGITFVDPTDNSNFTVVFTITVDGFIQMTLNGKDFANLTFEFPRKLNMILGISENDQTSYAPGNIALSSFSRIDLGDNLQHIVIESNLDTTSDQIGNVPLKVLTDFAPPTAYSNSFNYKNDDELDKGGFSTSLRQKLIYNPNERRYLDLISGFSIQTIIITAYYTDLDGNVNRIVLPFGGAMDIKLGFYKKV